MKPQVQDPVVFLSAARTPTGNFMGELSTSLLQRLVRPAFVAH